jgi:YfiH family protein
VRIIQPDWPAPAAVRALATNRSGGSSLGSFSSLNLGDHVGDDPQRVADNRQHLIEALGLPGSPHWLRQVHGSRVLTLPSATDQPADGAVTREPQVVCAVLTADCLPVLLARRDGAGVGVAHAGWRGLAAGVLENAVEAVGGPPREILAWLGPAISAAAYQVGDEVRAALLAHNNAAAAALTPDGPGHWRADLVLAARLALEASGVTRIYGGEHCTFSDPQFFSHRREDPCGRMAALIWLTPAV